MFLLIEVVKVLVGSGEDTDESVTLVRLSSYLSVSTEASDHPSDSVPEAATLSTSKSKNSELGYPDVPFRFEDDDTLELSSEPPTKPVLKPIEGNYVQIHE